MIYAEPIHKLFKEFNLRTDLCSCRYFLVVSIFTKMFACMNRLYQISVTTSHQVQNVEKVKSASITGFEYSST